MVIATPAYTGIAASPTPDGTFPVFERLRRQVMTGYEPNGADYADLVQYIAYFHGNDAVHYMDRVSEPLWDAGNRTFGGAGGR